MNMSDATSRPPEPEEGAPAQPVPRKKKKKKKQARARWLVYAGLGALGVAALVVTVWVVVSLMRGSPPARPVTAWENHTTTENEFSFDYPAGWNAKEYGIRGRRHVEVTGGSATINVKENLAGSLVGDITRAVNRGQPVPEERSPVAQVHELRRPTEPSSYKEEPAVTVTTRFGNARRSVYTDGSKRGYRATVLMHRTALDVYCECPASDWDTLRPAFERVIASLGRGGG
jgi:hypothetical protein